jgi:hypothetical protein
MTEKQFIETYCNGCGTQRCEGIGSPWFEGCPKRWNLDGYGDAATEIERLNDKIMELGFKLVKLSNAEPVRHARWIKITKPQKSNEGFFYWNAIPKTIYFCSYCGRRESIKEPYCHCGAKMDGKDCE